MTRLPGCPAGLPLAIPAQVQAPPIVTLSLPCLPMHQHHQLQAQLQAQARLAPMSPAPAQTPPLHTVPDLSHSPLTQQPGKPPDDFYSVHGDTHTEVDALDPSIMDFALQGISSAYSCEVGCLILTFCQNLFWITTDASTCRHFSTKLILGHITYVLLWN